MNKDVLCFEQVKVNHDLLEEIWKFDPRQLDHVDGAKLSSYAMALAQYLVYFTYQRNLSRAEQHRCNKFIDRTVSLIMSSEEIKAKKFKTKAAAADYIIAHNEQLMVTQTKLDALHKELMETEGMDKVISELIATIKRELTRRENELYQVRQERRN